MIHRVFKFNYYIFSIDSSMSGRMVISMSAKTAVCTNYIIATAKIKIFIGQCD
jgi:hypothetical protein